MRIIIDTREKPKATEKIEAEFKRQGIQFLRSKLPYGDYHSPDYPDVVVDRKQNLAELCANVSTVPKKEKDGKIKRYEDGSVMTELSRFTSELQGARQFGYKMVILCEHGGAVKSLEDVRRWVNPRLKESPLAMSGERLYIVLSRLMKTYSFDIQFCDKRNTGKRIIEILRGE